MKILKVLAPLFILGSLASCRSVDVDLNVNDVLKLKKNPIVKRDLTLNPGQYGGELSFKRKKVVLEINGIKGDVYFKIPGGFDRIPENGSRVFTPSQTGQPVTTKVEINTEVLSGDLVKTRESCSEIEYIQCWGDYAPGYNAVCVNGIAILTYYGDREVEYTPKTKNQHIELTLSKNGDIKLTGNGTLTDNYKVYHYQGGCELY